MNKVKNVLELYYSYHILKKALLNFFAHCQHNVKGLNYYKIQKVLLQESKF